jgi:hypothetical protein
MCKEIFSSLLGANAPAPKPTPAVAIAPRPQDQQQAIVKNPVSQIDTGFKPTSSGSGRSGRMPGLGL